MDGKIVQVMNSEDEQNLKEQNKSKQKQHAQAVAAELNVNKLQIKVNS